LNPPFCTPFAQSNDIQSKPESYGNQGIYSLDQSDSPDRNFYSCPYSWCTFGDGKVIACHVCSTSRKVTDRKRKSVDYPSQGEKRALTLAKGGISRVATEIAIPIDADREPIKVCPFKRLLADRSS
jgi:hypothetical protein